MHGREHRGQGGEHLPEALAHTGDVLFRLLGDSPSCYRSAGIARSVTERVGYLEAGAFTRVSAQDFIPATLTRVTGARSA